ncbi:hypothetical protein JCM17844_05190 [Iodidimonas gelatinilytica]|uniref:YicC family protein n=1 Tax=Iodidimonas gelatinilytica TaxID=1236966 RepID=A0A5A7MLL5_9PROT|nr:YicC/YloC family endoribonuclease [Iodidimonas gelatinilytica]GEQ96882.1 hypothetical protein JCM17844_05190 [Iodidimonas gelatinilytica]
MTVLSMTGFSRLEEEIGKFRCAVELKSVNGRGLDIRVRAPSFLDGFDLVLKKQISAVIDRGSVGLSLMVTPIADKSQLAINEEKLNQLVALGRQFVGNNGVSAPRLDGLLALPGVMESQSLRLEEQDRIQLEAGLRLLVEKALAALNTARKAEGAALATLLHVQIDQIEALVKVAQDHDSTRLSAIKDRLSQQIDALLGDKTHLSPERLEQEIALLAVKQDVREEIDRLHAHVAQARSLLAGGSPVGRKLDFLAQEFNREANTLCSKSAKTDLTRLGLDMKAVIDQFREQCQNVE